MSTCIHKALPRKEKNLKIDSPKKPKELHKAKRVEAQIQEKNLPLNHRVGEKSREEQWVQCGTTPFAHWPQSPWGSSLDPHMGHQNIDLKQIACQLFLQQKWVYSRSIKNCNLESVSMMSHEQIPAKMEKKSLLQSGMGSWECYNKERVYAFSLIEL